MLSMLSMRSAKSKRERESVAREERDGCKSRIGCHVKIHRLPRPTRLFVFYFIEIIECRMVKGKWAIGKGQMEWGNVCCLGGMKQQFWFGKMEKKKE